MKTANSAFVQYENCANAREFSWPIFLPKLSNFLPIYLHFCGVEQPEAGGKTVLSHNTFEYFKSFFVLLVKSQPQEEDASNDAKKLRTWL